MLLSSLLAKHQNYHHAIYSHPCFINIFDCYSILIQRRVEDRKISTVDVNNKKWFMGFFFARDSLKGYEIIFLWRDENVFRKKNIQVFRNQSVFPFRLCLQQLWNLLYHIPEKTFIVCKNLLFYGKKRERNNVQYIVIKCCVYRLLL